MFKGNNLQNLFCSLTWCLQTLSPPLGSGNEVLLHPPLPVGQILWWKKLYGTNLYSKRVSGHTLVDFVFSIFIRCLVVNISNYSPCGWLTNVVTQKFGILAISSDLFWKNGWRSLLYFCSTLRISSLACSFNLQDNNLSLRYNQTNISLITCG